jgi:hypothetical protein
MKDNPKDNKIEMKDNHIEIELTLLETKEK